MAKNEPRLKSGKVRLYTSWPRYSSVPLGLGTVGTPGYSGSDLAGEGHSTPRYPIGTRPRYSRYCSVPLGIGPRTLQVKVSVLLGTPRYSAPVLSVRLRTRPRTLQVKVSVLLGPPRSLSVPLGPSRSPSALFGPPRYSSVPLGPPRPPRPPSALPPRASSAPLGPPFCLLQFSDSLTPGPSSFENSTFAIYKGGVVPPWGCPGTSGRLDNRVDPAGTVY